MPRLHTIRVADEKEFGIPWPSLTAILSAPHVQEFELRGRLFHRQDCPTKVLDFEPVPLESFRYTTFDPLVVPPSHPSENHVLTMLLEKLSASLKILIIPSESAPFTLMARWDWSCLRALNIQGDADRVLECPRPLVHVLSRMRRLQDLSSKLVYGAIEPGPRPIWPIDLELAEFPWPEMEWFTVTWASPQDRVFDHLAPSLRRLSIRSWPRLYRVFQTINLPPYEAPDGELRWPGPLLPSAVIKAVLYRCRALRNLEQLDMEYEGGRGETELLGYISVAFPHLKALQTHCYTPRRDSSITPIDGVVNALTSLADLRVVRLFLGFQRYDRIYGKPDVDAEHRQDDHFKAMIAAFTRNTGQSLRYICLLLTSQRSTEWPVYRLGRRQDEPAYAERVDDLGEIARACAVFED